MFKIIVPTVANWGRIQWIFLQLVVSGTCSLFTVHQPPVLTAALGHDIMLSCELSFSHDDKRVKSLVLYWHYLPKNQGDVRLWPLSEKYKDRVESLDNSTHSSNKSILLKNVQWADSGSYLCKFSITVGKNTPFRSKGNETLLMVYDTLTFNLSHHNDSLLCCEVNVTHNPRFVLSIFHDGYKLQSVDSAPGDSGGRVAAVPFVTLSETIFLRNEGKYECQLHLDEDLITKSIFHYPQPVTEEHGYVERNISTISEQGVVVIAEPWLLYVALLLVPVTFLLGLLTARLVFRS